MARYRVVFRRPTPSQKNPLAERAFVDVATEQPSLAHALAWAYRQLANTKDAALVSQVVSVNVRLERDGQSQGGSND